jgi:ACT domain-containing protein
MAITRRNWHTKVFEAEREQSAVGGNAKDSNSENTDSDSRIEAVAENKGCMNKVSEHTPTLKAKKTTSMKTKTIHTPLKISTTTGCMNNKENHTCIKSGDSPGLNVDVLKPTIHTSTNAIHTSTNSENIDVRNSENIDVRITKKRAFQIRKPELNFLKYLALNFDTNTPNTTRYIKKAELVKALSLEANTVNQQILRTIKKKLIEKVDYNKDGTRYRLTDVSLRHVIDTSMNNTVSSKLDSKYLYINSIILSPELKRLVDLNLGLDTDFFKKYISEGYINQTDKEYLQKLDMSIQKINYMKLKNINVSNKPIKSPRALLSYLIEENGGWIDCHQWDKYKEALQILETTKEAHLKEMIKEAYKEYF